MGKSVTVNAGYDNVVLGQGVYDAGAVVAISDDEYANLVEAFGSLENLEVLLTIGGNVADPAVVPQSKEERLTDLESRVYDLENP